MAKQPLTREQMQTERHEEFAEKDPADGDGSLTVGEVSPNEAIHDRQEVPLQPAATTNPSDESQVDNEQDDLRSLSPNEVREKAESAAKKRAQPPANKGYGGRRG